MGNKCDMRTCILAWITWETVGNMLRMRNHIRDAQLCRSKVKPGQIFLKSYTKFSGTFLRQRTASPFAIKYIRGEYRWQKLGWNRIADVEIG